MAAVQNKVACDLPVFDIPHKKIYRFLLGPHFSKASVSLKLLNLNLHPLQGTQGPKDPRLDRTWEFPRHTRHSQARCLDRMTSWKTFGSWPFCLFCQSTFLRQKKRRVLVEMFYHPPFLKICAKNYSHDRYFGTGICYDICPSSEKSITPKKG